MDFGGARRISQNDSDPILRDLTSRQHLVPHQSVSRILEDSAVALNFCPNAAHTAMHWLQLDPSRKIGRLTRTELIQLARSIHRFWTQALSSHISEPQTA